MEERHDPNLEPISAPGPTVTAQLGRVIRAWGDREGVPTRVWMEECGVDEALLDQPGARVPRAAFGRLWRRLVAETGDEGVAFEIGKGVPFGTFGVVNYLIATARDVGSGFRVMNEVYRLIHDPTVVTLDVDGPVATWLYHVAGEVDDYALFAADMVFAIVVDHFRAAAGTNWIPEEVWLPHEREACLERYEAYYGCPVRLGYGDAQLIMSHEVLALPMPRADERLHEILRHHAHLLMERLPSLESAQKQVRLDLSSAIQRGTGSLSLEMSAQRLGVSGRTLQRRLRDEGTTFQAVLDEVRREYATRYLADAHRTIADVAYSVGFSDVSAFHRAFRRWTGRTPGDVRGTESA